MAWTVGLEIGIGVVSLVNLGMLVVLLRRKPEERIVEVKVPSGDGAAFERKRLRYWDRLAKICESAGR